MNKALLLDPVMGLEDPVISPTEHDYVDIAFRWRVANRGAGTALLGGRVLVKKAGQVIYAVHPGDRYSMRPDEPRYLLQYVGFLTELPPQGISEVSAWLQVGVEKLRGKGLFDVVVQICDSAQASGAAAPAVLEYTAKEIFSVGA